MYVDNTIVGGDMSNVVISQYDRIATALAAAEQLYAETRTRPGYAFRCVYNAWGQVFCGYMPGNYYDEVSTESVYGLARAADMDEAENLALHNCETIAEAFAEDNDIPSYEVDCKIIARQYCY